MSTIITRAIKGAPLSWAEADANLINLNTDKLEASALTPYATTAAVTAGLAAKINTSEIGVSVQAHSANLDEYAAVNPTAAGLALLDDADAAAQRATLGLVIGANVQAYDADIPTVSASQAEMEAGTETALRSMSPLLVKQAIAAQSIGQHMVRLHTANGYGSTNTAIRRFTTTVANTGSSITYADSATLGASFTVNTSGVYAISYVDCFTTTNGWLGLSLNSSQLTTQINGITQADILAVGNTVGANLVGHVSWTGYLSAGAVVRAHGQAGLVNGSGANAVFTISRVV